jgi:2-haloacid dehalogenase
VPAGRGRISRTLENPEEARVLGDGFEVLTFDCYGTLIDWERGLVVALREALGEPATDLPDDDLLALFADREHENEVPYQSYRDVLAATTRDIGGRLGVPVDDAAAARVGGSVGYWPAFPDSPDALRRLQTKFRLAVITNCDDDLFALSEERLGVRFDNVTTAQQARAYKPDLAPFALAHEQLDVPRERILHVAQSLFHDHVPAKHALGMTTVWIDRRGRGGGAARDADVTPDATFRTLAEFADAVGV